MAIEVTFTDLRRLMFMVEALRQSLTTGDPYKAVSDVYRGDEHLVADYDEAGVIRPTFMLQEYRRALATLEALAGPRPEAEPPRLRDLQSGPVTVTELDEDGVTSTPALWINPDADPNDDQEDDR